jgi:uncharacterized protein (TIGR02147 family)
MEGSLPSYRSQLQDRFDQRKAARPAYSLRAFARDLGYGAPQLSRVINGKQHLSLATARSIADRLFDSEREREYFVAQVEFEAAQNEKAREAAQVKLERIQDREFGQETVMLAPEDFLVISDWYHVPILYLTGLQGAPATIAGIAKYLGIGKAETGQAVERMERLKLLRKEGAGWVHTHARLCVPSGKASGAVRKYHKSMIEKALSSVEGQDVERRYLSARTIGIAPKDLPKFRALVDDFLARASVLATENDHRTKLYQFNVQMFDLDASALPGSTQT